MNAFPAEKLRVVLANRVFTLLYGISLDEWVRLVWRHRFQIDARYWPRGIFMTGSSLLTSIFKAYEDRTYGAQLTNVKVEAPVFVLGHWRSGTTHLHNLLAVDERFAYPNVWQALNPHTFLSTERYANKVAFAFPKTRIMDNVRFGTGVPFEDEFAICGTAHSPFWSWVLPRSADHYDRYLTFRDVSPAEVAAWKTALLRFYKKLTLKSGRPLLLKSPPHTARVKLLLGMFPDARFVHIHRNPYDVFRSTKRQVEVMANATRLQNPDWTHADARIIQRYKELYDVFFEERALIPPGQFHEVGYEQLEEDPIGTVKGIYEALALPPFDVVQPALERYTASIATYRKNTHADLPAALRSTLEHTWQRSFAEWGYATS